MIKIVPCVYANESGHIVRQAQVEISDEIVDAIMAFEAGELDEGGTVSLFQKLIDTNLVWQLQGTYERIAKQLLAAGLCTFNQKCAA